MYGWIYRKLPGPAGVRVALAVVLVLGVAALLLLVVFPAIEPRLPLDDMTIDR